MITYQDSGVDVERGYEAVRLMKEHVKRTVNDNVIGAIRDRSAAFTPSKTAA